MVIPGSSNVAQQPKQEFLVVKAILPILKGQLVRWAVATDSTGGGSGGPPPDSLPDGTAVATAGPYGDDTLPACGVAMEDAEQNEWFRILRVGFCDFMYTDGNVSAKQALTLDDAIAGAATGGGIIAGAFPALDYFGVSLADDSSNVLSAAWVNFL